ncbi:MAG: magnesium transporter [Oscillospiraceae bacterium]|nr:magnesium transporter [Oscillospiraceae bacterium]
MNTEIFQELLRAKKYKAVRSILEVMNAVDIASLLAELEDKELVLAFRLIPKDKAADVFAEMSGQMQAQLVAVFTERELRDILDDLYMDDTVDLLEDMPANLVTRILENVSREKRDQINILLNYPEDSAGSIMTTEYVDLRRDSTVAQAMSHIKRTGIHKETIYTCYVLEARRLVGIVSAKDLMTTDDDVPIEELMETEIISVSTHTDQEEVARLFSKYDLLAVPVLDAEERMVGIVTVDDAIDVVVDEATEDISIMAAISPTEAPYFENSVITTWKSRIPWLMLLMVSATFTGVIINNFESALAACIALTGFIPMLMDTAGNSGSQASVTLIRAMSLGEVEFKDIFRVIWKECRVAALCAVSLACVNFVKIWLVDRMLLHNADITILVDFVVCVSLAVTILLAKVVGCSLPMLAKKCGFDPAVMASPFITTIVDALSLLVYFAFAKSLLGIG